MKSSVSRRERIALALLLIFSLGIRVWKLGAFPDTVSPDEADTIRDAIRIAYSVHPEHGFFGFDCKPIPAFSSYLFAGFVRVFGENLFALRLPSALFSTLALLPFWWLVRRQFDAMAAFGATFLLATNLWFLNFSRSGWENIHIALWMLAAMVCLVKMLDLVSTVKFWALGATIFSTLGLYGYFGGRLILVSSVVFLLGVAFTSPFLRKRALISTICMGVGTCLLFLPQALTIRQHYERFNQRTAAVLIFHSPQWQQDPVGTARAQLVNNATGFWRGEPNQTPRYTPAGQPLLDRVTGLLLLCGMLASVFVARYRKKLETRLWWTMLLVSWAATQLLSVGTPDGARGVAWMPTLFFFVALSLDLLVRLFNKKPVVSRVLALGIFALGIFNLFSYVHWQSDSNTREARRPYLQGAEFEAWKADIIFQAQAR